jgi:cytochrome d ubiquinol oxidase subunit I
MSDFFFARSQMAMSLAFHIVFAALGIGMPLLMVMAEGAYLRTRRPVYLELSKRWAKGTAILFAVGAVSGTVLSFELGLLWPVSWERPGRSSACLFPRRLCLLHRGDLHRRVSLWPEPPASASALAGGVVVAVSGVFSGIFVVTANAWMNAPAGFKIVNGQFTEIDPVAAMLNPASFHEVLHMTLAAFVATGFAVAAVHAFFCCEIRQSFSSQRPGPRAGRGVHQHPAANLERRPERPRRGPAATGQTRGDGSVYRTQDGAPLLIGGIPDDATRTTDHALNSAWPEPAARQ